MKLRITVHGVAYEVDVEVLDAGEGIPNGGLLSRPSPHPTAQDPAAAAHPPAGAVASPIAGTVLEIRCRPGDVVEKGQVLLVVEAMKMKTSIAAPAPGKVARVPVAAGDNVREGQTLVEFA